MKGPVAWFASNRVAANLLMAFILVAGAFTIGSIKKEVFPEFSADVVTVAVPYPGAAPEDVEGSVCVRVEEAVHGVEGIRKITSAASEGACTVTLELLTGADARSVLEDVKTQVDAIDAFPEEAETPIVSELVLRHQVLSVAVHGEADERTLKALGERVRDEISALPGITQVELRNARPYEISVEVSERALRRHGLDFDAVATAVRRSSLDLPGGVIRTEAGEVLLRTEGQARRGAQLESLVLLTRPDGTRLELGDVADVRDAFADTDQWSRFDGDPAVLVQVFRVGEQSALDVSRRVHEYLGQARHWMPEGVSLTAWNDDASILRSRLDLLVRNGRSGLVLVFLVLAVFLKLRLAFWVSLGIPISFLGAIALMPWLGISINLLSLFAFIVVLGIVVDDAIVVAENVHAHRQRGKPALTAAIDGTREVAVPVTFAVLTTVAAFAPMMFVPGTTGKIWRVIPIIVISTLLFSWLESKLILPAHLAHEHRPRREGRIIRAWSRLQSALHGRLEQLVTRVYSPSLERALRLRYVTLAAFVAVLLLALGLPAAGWVKLVFMPNVEADFAFAGLTMPQGTPAEVTSDAVRRLEEAAEELSLEIDGTLPGDGEGVFRHVLASVGEQPARSAQESNAGGLPGSFSGAHLGEVTIQLAPSEERAVTSGEVVRRWRELTGPIPGAVELTYDATLFSVGAAIDVQLTGRDLDQLRSAADSLQRTLREYDGVSEVADSFREGKQEVELDIRPGAEALGLTLADLARQVRQAFHGEEAQRVQRGRDDVEIVVRYPEEDRRSRATLEAMRIRTPDGAEVPFSTVARVSEGRGFATIRRADRKRAINVTADVDPAKANATEVQRELEETVLPRLVAEHPGVSWTFEGERREQRVVMQGLLKGFGVALLVIYGLMAVPFRSYVQPLIVMSAIPFGFVGAVAGHVLMGHHLSVLSLCGMVALAGVVVNDSLVLVDFVNRRRREGLPLHRAIRVAGAERFRPILLTSLTTFAGLTPLLLERSVQAQFLVPMAISLAFGVLFATLISLVLVPASYLVLEDVRRVMLGRRADAAGHENAA